EAKISISTLEKALAGRRPFTLATTVRLEEALGVSLRKAGTDFAGLAPAELGFYSRPAVALLQGAGLPVRPSLRGPPASCGYPTEIRWDADSASLVFRESERIDAEFAQQGLVSVPNESGYVYLVTNRQGQHRLVIISRPIYGEMFGIMTTLQVGRGNQL